MAAYSLTAGSGVVLLSTEWNQAGLIPESEIRYNEYCPTDPLTGKKSVTGCTNTAAAQILYYWSENSDFTLDLQLTQDDSYVSEYEDRTITIDATQATAQANGYLSFDEVNQKLSDFTIGDASDIAALCFACGVVQQACYSSSATSTAWQGKLFFRSGMACFSQISSYSNVYFYGPDDTISDAVFDILIEELLAGRPVGAAYPEHALVVDGYDQNTDRFHINYGWGGSMNGWYSRDEMNKTGFYWFYVDIMPYYDGGPIIVTNAAAYGGGTLIRGIEQLEGIPEADTLTVETSGIQISLESPWYFEKAITINNLNANITASTIILYDTGNLNINGLSGDIESQGSVFQSETDLSVSDFTGNISAVWSAFYSNGNFTGTRLSGTISGVFNGLYSEGDMTVNGLSGTISGVSNGLYSEGDMTVNGLSGTISGVSNGLYSEGDMTVNGFSASVRASNLGVCAAGDISLTYGTGSIIAEAGSIVYALKGKSVSQQNFSGIYIAAGTNSSHALSVDAGGKLEFSANGARFFAGSYTSEKNVDVLSQDLRVYGEAGVEKAMQHDAECDSASYSVSSSSCDDTVFLKNYSSLQGVIYLEDGNDTLSVLGGSYVYAPSINRVETVNIDSTSSITVGMFYGSGANSLTINTTITAETPSDEMICYQGCFYNFYDALKDKKINIDLRAATDGEYVLINAAGAVNADYYLPLISVQINTGSGSIFLKCGESSSNISLKCENEKLILVLDGFAASKAEALLFDGEQLLSVSKSVSNLTLSCEGTDSLRLTNGGTADDITVNAGSDLSVSGNGIATGTVVNANGFLAVNRDGRAANTTVKANGIVNFGIDAVHTGALVIEDDGKVFAEKSAVIDFTISGFPASSYTGISDFSRITGTPQYTLSVSKTQSTGQYVLAGNAAGFDSTITINGLDKSGSISLDSSFTDNDKKYELSISAENQLLLSIYDKSLTPIVITADSLTKKYDGSTLEGAGYTYAGNLQTGDNLVNVVVSGSQTDAGSSDSTISSYKIMRGTLDVTAGYDVKCVAGTLTVNARDVTISSASDTKEYDGTPLTNDTITVSGDGFISGEGYSASVTGTQTNVGTSANTFTYTLNDGTKSSNYNITVVEGELTVTQAEVPQIKEIVKDGNVTAVSWTPTSEAGRVDVALAKTDSPDKKLIVRMDDQAIDIYSVPENMELSLKDSESSTWSEATPISGTATGNTAEIVSNANDTADLFFANASGTWTAKYVAKHVGSIGDWSGTNERVRLGGKNKIADTFAGSDDANILLLTDDDNGDALFVDDIYTVFPNDPQSRIAQIDEIRAGAGDDIVDMTSRQFEYIGDGVVIRGGEGNDTIWANRGNNMLFGDAGNDRMVGASGNDVLVGGIGNDSMHGGGGDDVFCFCNDWGTDMVEQLSSGTVTLWFAEGSQSYWNADTLTYSDGANSVKVTGITAEKVTLKFGDDGSVQFNALSDLGAFNDVSSGKIFETKDNGVLASL